MSRRLRLLASLVMAVAFAGEAQTVYRCGADGRTYSQEPCPEGRKLDASDPRTTAQRIEGERAAAREKALADNLERDRRAEEASRQAATMAASFKAQPAVRAASEPVRHVVRRRSAR